MDLIKTIPRPVRDFFGPSIITHKEKADSQQALAKGELYVGYFSASANLRKSVFHATEGMLRISAAGLGALAVYQLGVSAPIIATLGSLASLPAVAILGGSFMLYHGTTALVTALASPSFITLGLGLAGVTGGWLTLEFHDVIPFGLVEGYVFSDIANNSANSQFILNMLA